VETAAVAIRGIFVLYCVRELAVEDVKPRLEDKKETNTAIDSLVWTDFNPNPNTAIDSLIWTDFLRYLLSLEKDVNEGIGPMTVDDDAVVDDEG
jgi:hypothetical protein